MAGAVPPLGALPAIPSAAAGIAPPNPLAELAAAAGQYQPAVDRQKLVEAELAKSQEAITAATQQRATQRLQTLVQMGQGSSTLPYDPGFQASIDQAVKEAGILPRAPRIDEVIPGTEQSRQRIDLESLIPMRDPGSLTPTEWQTLDQSDPTEKRAKAKAMRVNLGEDYLNQPPRFQLGSQQMTTAMNQFQTFRKAVFDHEITPEQFMSNVEFFRRDWDAAYGQGATDKLVNDPTVLGALSDVNQAKLDNLRAAGVKVKAEAQSAHDASQLRSAQAKYYLAKATQLPIEDQHKWAQIQSVIRKNDSSVQTAHDKLDNALKVARINAGAKSYGELRGAITSAQSAYNQAQHEYDAAMGKIAARDAQGLYTLDDKTNISQDLTEEMKAAKAKRDSLKDLADQAQKELPDLLKSAVQQHYGPERSITNVSGPGASAPTPPHPGMVHGTMNGQAGWAKPGTPGFKPDQ